MPTHTSGVALSNGADDDEAYEGEAMAAHAAEYGGPTGSPSGGHPDDERDVGYAFTKESTAEQSISAWDNYKESSLSFDRIHTARRDANSAIGDYVARVAGISLQDKADYMAREDMRRAASSPSRDVNRDPRSSSTRGSDIRTQEELGFINRPNTLEDYRLAADMDALAQSSRRSSDAGIRELEDARRDWKETRQAQIVDYESPSLVDEWGQTEEISTWGDTPATRWGGSRTTQDISHPLRSKDLDTLTSENKAARDLAEATKWGQENLGLDFITDVSLTPKTQAQIELDELINLEIKQADAVLASSDTTTEQKVEAATKKNAAISDKNRLMMQQRRNRARQEYNAVIDPTATVYSKDVHTRVGFDKLNAYIASVAEKQFFNTRFNYTKHDPATTMKVQKAIERYDDIYGSWLNDMGKRNSKEINAKGFDLSKGAGYMGVNVIQGMFNKLGWAYHATTTEKMLRALKSKWGLGEDEPEGGLPLDQQETRCNERSGYKWDEETNTCIPISNLNTDYQDYLP